MKSLPRTKRQTRGTYLPSGSGGQHGDGHRVRLRERGRQWDDEVGKGKGESQVQRL